MDHTERRELAETLARLAEDAGRVILDARAEGAAIARKSDGSPVTDADLRCEAHLLDRLDRMLPELPVVAEESVAAGRLPDCGRRFLLVDPLDGTREFVAGSKDFTVNIAVVEDDAPVLGVVHAPAHGRLFLGWAAGAALERRPDEAVERVLRTGTDGHGGMVALLSRSHGDETAAALVARLKPRATRALGSALKFGLIAAGEGDLYPRFSPTMAWDTAAGQAVLEAAGGVVVGTDKGPLRYRSAAAGRPNPPFIAAATRALAEAALG